MDGELLIGIFPQGLLDGIILGFISAIGLSFFLQDMIRLFESLWRNAFNLVYPTIDVLNLRFELTETLDVSVKSLVVIGGALLMLWALHLIVNRTKVGTAIRAVAEDQAAASLMGIDVNRIISLTFLIGGAMGGAAGVLFRVQYGLINPYSGFIPGLAPVRLQGADPRAAPLGPPGDRAPGADADHRVLQQLLPRGRDPGRHLRRAGARPQHRRRPGGALGPRVRGLLRGRRLLLGHLRLTARQHHLRRRELPAGGLVGLRVPLRRPRDGGGDLNPAPAAGAAAARRLSRHRHARLR